MFLKIKQLLLPPETARLVALSRELRFVDGRVSNPANVTKNNLQVDAGDPRYAESVQIVSAAFARSREFADFARESVAQYREQEPAHKCAHQQHDPNLAHQR